MEYEANDMKILELINRRQNTFGALKTLLRLKNDELEKILDILDQNKLITTSTKTGLLGKKKIVINITDEGTKKNYE